jgi:hypothetical protein
MKNENKNTGLFINCMDFVVPKQTKNKILIFFVMLGPCEFLRTFMEFLGVFRNFSFSNF